MLENILFQPNCVCLFNIEVYNINSCRSFVVIEQPPAVLKTGHKLETSVRLLLGDDLLIKAQLDQAKFTVKITSEENARQLMAGMLLNDRFVIIT